jgi:hypothetical protein
VEPELKEGWRLEAGGWRLEAGGKQYIKRIMNNE